MDIKAEVYNEVIAGHAEEVKGLTAQAMEEGFDAQQLLNDSLIAGLVEVGHRFETGELWVPEMIVSARASKQ